MRPKQGTIYIEITYNRKEPLTKSTKMTEDSKQRGDYNRKFICSICLNTRPADSCKPCQLCQRSCPNSHGQLQDRRTNSESYSKEITQSTKTDTKTIQTSQTDVSKGLNLLNEVLNVFQTKKSSEIRKSKTVILKDASVSTERNSASLQKLSTSKIFQHSIEGESCCNRNKFVIVSSSQPCYSKASDLSIDLNRPKSSSIPQMKLEQLKHSMKEITPKKSNDATEEVNRMFANVMKVHDDVDNSNRPVTRLGPRVLPVVKTRVTTNEQKQANRQTNKVSPRLERVYNKDCSCCVNYNLSSGDSSKNAVKNYADPGVVKDVCCQHNHCYCNSARETTVCRCCKKNEATPRCCYGSGRCFDDRR